MFCFENEIEKTISDEVQTYAQKEYESQLVRAMQSKQASSHASIAVDSMSLFESNIGFAHYMFQNPRRALKLLDDAFQKVSYDISKDHILKNNMIYKENLHVRLIALPNLPEVYRSNLPNCSDVGQFLCISGTVVRTSSSKMLQYKKLWRCSKCKYQFTVEAEVEQGYICEKPVVCNNPEWCNGKNFTLMSTDINTEWCKDYQEIKLQEQVYNLNVGTVPRSMWVVLEDDLVELCYPGNDVIVSGVLIQQWKPFSRGGLIDIDLVILAHNIEVQNRMSSTVVSKDVAEEFVHFWQNYKADPLSGRNFILSCVCPQVFGLYIVKLAVALVLAGGVQKESCSSRIRGDSHLLLIGDPGTAKSQFLKFATKVSSRSVLTSGIGTTNAGLTVSAVKESGRWELEAGALVLADGGICCIDEFSCIKEQDKTCIHEAMEQQTISVAKAGLVCSLNTRCTILAATNPKGKYDENMSISENTALGSPLLSRFDIILVLLDKYDENWDDMVSSYILDGRNILNKNDASWSIEKMKSYFVFIRQINPKVSADAEKVLHAYYTKQRSLQSRNASRTTPRLLQSLIRLAEGHARLMFRTEVLVIDALLAIILIESSMLGNSILEGLSPLHTIFPSDPADEYKERAEKVLQNLNINFPTEENYEHFYEESNLKNLLSNIYSVWSSKENPYLFRNPTCNSSSNINMFLENSTDSMEMITDKSNSANTEDLIHKTAHFSNISAKNSTTVQSVVVEVHRNDYGSSTKTVFGEFREVTTLSDLRNVFEMTQAETSKNVFDKNASANVDNFSIIHQVLEEPDFQVCHDAILAHPKLNNVISNIQLSCNNIKQIEILNEAHSTPRENSSNHSCVNNFEESPLNKSNIELEECGITSKKESQNEDNVTNAHLKCSKTLPEKSISVSSILPAKRSLSDQLKKFVFSKSHSNSQHNSLNNEATASSLNSKNGSKCNIEDAEAQSQNNINIENKTEINPHVIRKSAFKMIVEKSKNSLSQFASNSFRENVLNTSKITSQLQSEMCSKNQKTDDVIYTKEEPEIKEIDNFMVDTSSNNSTIVKQPQSTSKRKPIPDKLKMFVFKEKK